MRARGRQRAPHPGSAQGVRATRVQSRGQWPKQPEARAAAGAPALAPAEMWEPRVGGGVAMTTEGRDFGLKASPFLNRRQMPSPYPPDMYAHPLRGGWLEGGGIFGAVLSPHSNLSPGPLSIHTRVPRWLLVTHCDSTWISLSLTVSRSFNPQTLY